MATTKLVKGDDVRIVETGSKRQAYWEEQGFAEPGAKPARKSRSKKQNADEGSQPTEESSEG